MLPSITEVGIWFEANSNLGIGIILTIIGIIFTLSELKVYFVHKSTSEQLVFWIMALIAGVITILFKDLVLGLLAGISLLMVIETIKMLDTPVWGKLMAATTITYFVILLGRAGQVWYDWYNQIEDGNDLIFSSAFNLSFPIFLLVSFVFFGRKFLLVSKFSSPQVIYLFLFGIVYGGIIALQDKVFEVDEKGLIQSWNYLNIEGSWRKHVIFADFGTFEALTIVMIVLYFISGWLLTALMGVRTVEDPEILRKVQEVAKTMGINQEIKVGFSPAPILNAFAYGPFFDKRVAFISSNINDFSDADIRGIVGHELAHASRNHIVILLLLSIVELAIKKALLLPATALDYSLLADEASASRLDFVGYFIFSYILLVFMMIVVRILEGDADKMTKDAGYAEDLTQALFRLEGFYNGVASDFGISVNLLTDRKYSIAEKRRFTAQAAIGLYKDVLSPSRGAAFANIFQSHPKTAYRIAALVTPEKNPRKSAMLPYRLLGFFMRKKAIKELSKVTKEFHTALDKSYINDYGDNALTEVLKYNPYEELYTEFIGKNVITFNGLTQEVTIGEFKQLIASDRVTSPLFAIIGEEKMDLAVVDIKEYNIEKEYFLKDGTIVKLTGHTIDRKKNLQINVQHSFYEKKIKEISIINKTISFKKFGKSVDFILDLVGKEVIHFEKGLSRLKTIDNIELNDTWSESSISIDGTILKGKDLIVSFSPLGFEVRKNLREEQLPLLKSLINTKILAYTKENFDVSISGRLTDIDDNKMIIRDADGDQEIFLDRLQYVISNKDSIEIITKEHVSLFTKIGIWWSNRKEFNYIVG